MISFELMHPYSAAASGWAEFGSSVNHFTTKGADYALQITASPPGFENPAASLPYNTLNVPKIVKLCSSKKRYIKKRNI